MEGEQTRQPGGARRTVSRRGLLQAAAALSAAGAVIASGRAFAPNVLAQAGADVELCNLALTWEHLERDFVNLGLERDLVAGRDRDLIQEITAHFDATIRAIAQAVTQIGGTPIAEPAFTFPDETLADRNAFLRQATAFAELGVSCYHGSIAVVQRPELLELAAGIAGTKSRHAAVLAAVSRMDPLPASFEQPLGAADLLERAQPYRGEG